MEFLHTSVLSSEVVKYLGCRAGGVYVDGTLGGGGHTVEILKASAPDGISIGIDLDEDAIKAAGRVLEPFKNRVRLVRDNFKNIKSILAGLGVEKVDGIVLDVGVSSYQLESPERGFSFRLDARLDMRMDKRQKASAYDLVNTLPGHELAGIFRKYGEEREARRIARLIEKARQVKPVETTGELASIVLKAIPGKFYSGGIHPATRVFQALRIAVNDELQSLTKGLPDGITCLKSGGRFVVISFHSLEDRIVKNIFRDSSTGCVCPPRIPMCVCGRKPVTKPLTKKAVTASAEEVRRNPRARSAKLRAVEKL